MKFCAPSWRWNPSRSAPSNPFTISSRHGMRANSSYGRERDVVEEADPHVGAPVAEHLRHELQVVVVDPDHRVGWRDLRQRVGEAPVHPHVGLPLPLVVAGLTDRVVVQRPQACRWRSPRSRPRRRRPRASRGATGRRRSRTAAAWSSGTPVHPIHVPPLLTQEREQRPHETTGAGLPSVVRARHREAVGGDDEGTLRHRVANA